MIQSKALILSRSAVKYTANQSPSAGGRGKGYSLPVPAYSHTNDRSEKHNAVIGIFQRVF